MSDFNILDPNGLLPGEPLTSAKVLALYDNPLAIAEGADDAPRISYLAMSPDDKIADDGLALTVTAADTYSAVMGFTIVVGTLTTASATNVVGYTITALGGLVGTLRFKVIQQGLGGTSELDLFKNNALVTSFTTTNATAGRSVDVAIASGDVIEWRHRQSSGSNNSILRGVAITASDTYERIGALIKATDL